ncbi:MAG: hypothetical protein M1814_004218 [Vezdaea aestivalis]|nr:MAG: hypothetical protein M1814_004218 [Vezdaea aestivalis]
MRTPVRLRGPRGPGYEVNTSSEVLDEAYVRVLGPGGDKVLSEEIKWLAVTHKSFDQGSRGFFDRLTYLGKRITELQTSIALIQNGAEGDDIILDSGRRESKVHAALKGLSNLHLGRGHLLVSKGRMADLARRYKLLEVVRWTPKYLDRLEDSGVALVLAQTMYAIVGAVALQKGGEVASRMVRERILGPLGIIE